MADTLRASSPAEPRHDSDPTPSLVVGLGASAGGIQALAEFFARAEPEPPIAYVVILHLSPEHESRLAEVLQARTSLPVDQVRATMTLQPRRVYVIPPNENLQVADGKLVLTPMMRFEERKAPVDMFFRTLAEHYGAHAAAVVLSGTGPNGSNGLKRVKEHGGLTIAQLPEEAEYGDMPTNAIGTGLVDYVLPVAEIPRRLVEYERRVRWTPAHELLPPTDDDAEGLREVMTLLRIRTGHDFANYKPATVRRRIDWRMSVRGMEALADYVRLLRDQPDEAVALMKELLISVTNFFREPSAFAALERRIIPRLFDAKSGIDQVRVWSAGCATGEEAYSIAMLLAEHAGTLSDPPALQIFATDLDEQAIGVGRDGVYSEADVADLTPERLTRFFHRDAGGYRVRRELREMLLFAHHNLLKDPPFSHLDLVVCRNLLIYLNRTVQERVIETFHFALRPNGYLFLGGSETPETAADLFAVVDKEAHVYESRSAASRLPTPVLERAIAAPGAPTFAPPPDRRPLDRISGAELHLRMLEQFAPPSLVVTDEHTVVHMSESVGRFLVVAGGEPTRDLFKMLHPALRSDVRTALYQAGEQRQAVEVEGARLSSPGGDTMMKIIVRPILRDTAPRPAYFVVMFEDVGATPAAEPAVRVAASAAGSEHLDEEFARVRDQLRLTVEQYETQAEEAKAANEELQAMNEELRSAAEELETSKEELQSVNEELTTVNQELKIKIEELGLTNNDFQNLINATDIGAIFLDKALRVKLSTPRAQQIFNLLPTDAGRRLSDITNRIEYPELHEDVAKVLDRLQSIEREVQTRDRRWYSLRIVPYRTVDDRIEGVALTFQDITTRREAEQRMRRGEERLRLLVESAVDYAIFTMTTDGTIDAWNSGAERVFGYGVHEIVGKNIELLFTPEDRAAGVPAQELATARARGRAEDERWHLRRDGSRFYSSGVTTALGDEQGFAKIARDLTSQRRAEMALQQARAELEQRVQQRTVDLRAEVSRHAEAQDRVTALLRKVVTAQEDERTRIARDLHDQLGQQLTTLRLTLERHRTRCTETEDVDSALKTAERLDSAVDFLAWELRPTALDDLGLAAALPRYAEEWSAHTGVRCRFRAEGFQSGMLSREAEIVFYRVAQEALNNVLKHAHAERVDILLEGRDTAVVMVVEDNGIGFDPADRDVQDNGLGLAGMRERAALIGATLEIESSAGQGTTIFLRCAIATAAQQQA